MARGNKRSTTLRVLGAIAGVYLAAAAGLALLQSRFIFQPETLSPGHPFSFPQPFEELTISSPDGAQLNALYFTVPHPKGAILYFHGNKGSLKRWGAIAGKLTKYGYNLIVMDYRGYGKSTGTRSEGNMQADARLWYREMQKRFSEDSIVVYGRSLGSHFATLVSAENRPRHLILETPFTSITEVARRWFPFLPVKNLIRFEFNNLSLVQKVKSPLTVIHGTADRVVPYRLGKKLFDAAQGNKTLITIPGGSHHNLAEYEDYHTALEQVLGAAHPNSGS